MEQLALQPPRALEPPAGSARIRLEPEDFQVEEVLGFAPSGAGEHVLLRVRKRGANTQWVARELAAQGGVRVHDVGYAGLKDRHAVTTQWFSVPARRKAPAAWLSVRGEGYEVEEAHAHQRKLPRGALEGNRFVLRMREFVGDRERLTQRVAAIAAAGVPNYFGPQRFGRELANLRPGYPREQSFRLSAARSLIFNAVLAERIARGNWLQLHVGERANLDGRNSSFIVEALDAALDERLQQLDIHPTGPLWGEDGCGIAGEIAELEQEVAGRYPELLEWLRADRVAAMRRPLRMAVRELELDWLDEHSFTLKFFLRSGSFATAVVRELIEIDAPAGVGQSESEHA